MNRTARYRLLKVVTVSLLLFCGSLQAQWVKQGATEADLKRDQTECEMKARADTSFNTLQPMRGSGTMASIRNTNNLISLWVA